MRFGAKTLIIATIIAGSISLNSYAESLFRAGVSENAYPIVPRSLFSSIKAKSIGDIITITVKESTTTSDNLKLSVNKKSSVTDNFTTFLKTILPDNFLPNSSPNNFGGNQSVSNNASTQRTTTLNDTITTQVVQVLPNGNLMVQGKKTAINAGEHVNIILSGIVDPRLIDQNGTIASSKVANLQIAVAGKGTISRSDNEGIINKFIRYVF
ncbi:MAG: flagellar basal body L-ring protein FlgH [Candidatus Gastranaerophilaceae bacterium]|jgi:flagellar L-ring protein precursor FlgH